MYVSEGFQLLAKMSPVDIIPNRSDILALSRISSRVGKVRWVCDCRLVLDSV